MSCILAAPRAAGEPSSGRLGGMAFAAAPQAVLAGDDAGVADRLAAYEHDRARTFVAAADRLSYVAAHVLVRQAAARAGELAVDRLVLAQRCAHCGGPHGKPVFPGHPGLHVSFSHCRSAVAAVAGPSPNAIDVESWDGMALDDSLVAGAFTAAEQQQLALLDPRPDAIHHVSARQLGALRLWVRKECLVKLGRLSLDALASVAVLPLAGDLLAVPPANTTSSRTIGALLVTDWIDVRTRTVGAVACEAAVDFRFGVP